MNDDPFVPDVAAVVNPYAASQMAPSPFAPSAAALQRPPRVWTVFVTVIVTFVAIIAAQIVAGIGIVLWHFARGGSPQGLQGDLLKLVARPDVFICLGLMNQAVIGGMALAAAWLSPQPMAARLGLVAPRQSALGILLMCVGSLVPFAIGMAAAYALAEVIEPDPTAEALYEQMTPALAVPFLLFIALAPGLCEEILFRGYVQRRLLERWNPWLAIGITSVVFALFHVTPHAVVFAFPVGIWLGLMAWNSGSIWPGALCHAAINGLWNVWHLGVRFNYFAEQPPLWFSIGLVVVGVAAFALSLWMMFVTSARASPALRAP
ncbi:MAG: CPBP family intramembrane glutamic endopeptidase [Pirellulaceae bacterium]